MGSPWPLAAWGMDASTYKAVTKKVVADFVGNNIICRFGIPKSIITDNAAKLNKDLMREICKKFRIIHRNSTAYRPQKNGVVEAANKNIKRILRKIVDNHKQWHEKLPFSLVGYRTTMRTSTGAMSYMLVYDTKAVIPVEVEIPSLRVTQEAKLDDAKWIQIRQEQLMLTDEKRMDVVCHGQLYQNRMASAFNKRVKPRQFAPGQLVLKKIFPHQEEAKGKFAPNWQGPYVVHRPLSGGALILENQISLLYVTQELRRLDFLRKEYAGNPHQIQLSFVIELRSGLIPFGYEQTPQCGTFLSSKPNYNVMRDIQPISGPRIQVQDDK
ncbi:uncharacterized protein [Nicotiana tomentosiformis]|uniref:uncharacterized protein n=1 Tax=Nicotiana tomentosiformis TaxID=4098 RepID=UPI00388CBDCF